MPFYNLLVVDQQKILSTPAQNCDEALSLFGKELSLKLTLDGGDRVAVPYLLDEWEVGPHWTNPTIPVFVA